AQRFANLRLFLGRRARQHVVDDVAARAGRVARMADAEAQAPESGPDVLDDVRRAVVPGRAAAVFELHAAGGKVELVVGDEHALGRDLVVPDRGTDRLAAQVHVGLRLEQPDSPPGDRDLGRFRAQLAVAAEAPAVL